ncbi:MAG: class I SAM-dependent methyltransferase family protein, partial [Thermoplasmata archaeon]|nr:class I SAM-dependent methyltransferase family protein [Thermoplasmata archaeon]
MVRCVRVPKREGEPVRARLLDEGILDVNYRIGAEGDSLLIPVLEDVPGFECADADLRPQERPAGDYREMVDLPDDLRGLLPMSFDVVGDVGMVKIPEELAPYRADIGRAMMRANHSLRCVFEDRGVKGELRVRDLDLIAGEGPSETVHREFGARMHTDPARVYFNPRLAGERHRVASLVRDGEVVIDMFAGVAPFGVQICRAAKPEAVYSIDLNPDAEAFACWNREDNRADALVPITGDATAVVPTLPMADRIIMNLPQIADRFLPLALSRLKRGGTVHMYKIIEREEFLPMCEEMVAMSAENGHTISMESFELKTYSPTMSVYSLD